MDFQNEFLPEKDTTNLQTHGRGPQGGRLDTGADKSESMSAADIARSEELSNLWFGFLTETACHGVKNIRSQTRSKAVRTLYGIIVIGSLCGLLLTVFLLLSRVVEYNTVTRTEIYVDPNITFPTVTFCNICKYSFRGKNDSDPLYRLLAKASIYGDLFPDNDLNQPPFSDFLQQSTKDVFAEYLMDLDIRYAKYDGRKIRLNAFETLDTQYGRCRQFNGHDFKGRHEAWLSLKRRGKSGLTMLVNIRQYDYGIVEEGTAGLRVYISQSNDFARVDSHAIAVMPGTSTRIAIKPHKISFLPHPYKSFGSQYCTDADPSSPELVAKMVNSTFYSFDKCQSQCVVYQASMECHCHVPELVIPELKICTMYEYMLGCYLQASKRIQMDVSNLCDCPRPCSFDYYGTTLSASKFPSRVTRDALMKLFNFSDFNILKDNFLEVQVYFDSPLIWVEKHHAEYTINSFMSSLGGQLGLCLGASLITVMEFWELILRTVVVSARRLRRFCFNKVVTTKESGFVKN